MKSIFSCGSEEQKQRRLGPMARPEKTGAFAPTEPDHGSDAVSSETTATPTPDGDSDVLDGHKKWIGNGIVADVVVVGRGTPWTRQSRGPWSRRAPLATTPRS